MKKNTIILKINLSKDDFNTTVKVEKKHFTKKEKNLLKIALFTLQNQMRPLNISCQTNSDRRNPITP